MFLFISPIDVLGIFYSFIFFGDINNFAISKFEVIESWPWKYVENSRWYLDFICTSQKSIPNINQVFFEAIDLLIPPVANVLMKLGFKGKGTKDFGEQWLFSNLEIIIVKSHTCAW